MQSPEDSTLAEAINECMDALRRGESIDDCLSRYPDMADELRPLLLTMSATAGIAPMRDEELRQVSRLRFEGAVQHHLAVRERTASHTSLLGWWKRQAPALSRAWAIGMASLVLAVVLSTGAAYASTDALPDSPLYPVKRATEHARLAMTFSDESRAIYYLELIERRTLELAAVAESGDTRRVENLSRDILRNIELSRVEAGYMQSALVPEQAVNRQTHADASTSDIPPDAERSASTSALQMLETPLDAQRRAYIEAERSTAEQAYVLLLIAYRIAPDHARGHVLNTLTLAEQRYRQTRLTGEPAPFSRTLFAQGIVRIEDEEMTLAGSLTLEISSHTLGNRSARDGDFATVGGYVRNDGTLLVLRLLASEAGDVTENQIWLQAETLGRNDERIFIPGFNITPADWTHVSLPPNQSGRWIYVRGAVTDGDEVTGEEVYMLGEGPILFPQP